MNVDATAALNHAEMCARKVGERLKCGFGAASISGVKSTEAADVVTTFDVEAEEQLYELLSKFDSSVGFKGEESGRRSASETFWLVDPIDGTGHFLRGLPFCTTMIALIEDGKVVVSVIHDFVNETIYSAARGTGATCNGDRIHASERSLSEAYIGLEMDLTKHENTTLRARLRSRTTLLSTISSGWEFAMIAAGKLDGRLMKDPWGKTWDYAPGSLLVAEAGGRVANIGSTGYDYRNRDFIAAGPQVYLDLTDGRDAMFPIR